jgi:hypothetical protein
MIIQRLITVFTERSYSFIPCFRLIKGVQVFTQSGNDTFILVGIFTENILKGLISKKELISRKIIVLYQDGLARTKAVYLDDDYSFLYDIVDFGLNKIQQCTHTLLS